MNVLVVGGAGYVGGVVTDLLAKEGHKVRVYDALLYEEAYRKPIEFIYGDIRDDISLKPHLKWSDAVIWLAALVGDPACSLHPAISTEINQDSVGWLAQNFDGRITFISTCSVYGAQDGILDESAQTNPLSVYAVTKLNAEAHLKNKNAIIFRLGTLFGVGDLFSRIRLDLVVNILAVRAYSTQKIIVFGGDQFRPLLHVRDAARAIASSVSCKHVGIYNLNKQNVRIADLAYQIRNHFPDCTIKFTEMPFQDKRNYRVSTKKAETILGFIPSCTIDDGIEEIKNLLVTKRLKDLDNPRYTNQSYLSLYNSHLRI
jgi:nucleoside-diphosphate-sugar epimerase